MSITVHDGALITKDPAAVQTYRVEWSENLGAAQIGSHEATVRAIHPATVDAALVVTTAAGGLGLQAGNQAVLLQLAGGTLGQLYEVTSRVVTNETPTQTKERSFTVLIENT